MKIVQTAVAAAVFALGAGALHAQTEMDSNGDGMYSFEELLAAFPALTEDTFTTADASGDGLLDADELAAAQADGVIPTPEG